MEINELTYQAIGCAYKVHKQLGPGLLESTYELCMVHELYKIGCPFVQQKSLPVYYDGYRLDGGYKIDLLISNQLIVEIKSVEQLAGIHRAQLMTYLKLSNLKVGLLLNFNVVDMKTGIQRVIM